MSCSSELVTLCFLAYTVRAMNDADASVGQQPDKDRLLTRSLPGANEEYSRERSVHQASEQRRGEVAFAERRNDHYHQLAGIFRTACDL